MLNVLGWQIYYAAMEICGRILKQTRHIYSKLYIFIGNDVNSLTMRQSYGEHEVSGCHCVQSDLILRESSHESPNLKA